MSDNEPVKPVPGRSTAKKSTPRPSFQRGEPGGRPAFAALEGRSEGASTELSRKINRDVVLELIRLRQPLSRVELARASGLQNSTVSLIVEQLASEGWIREGEALKTSRGRRPTQISLNDGLAMLVADVHPGRAIVGVVNLNGKLIEQEEIKLPATVQRSIQELGTALVSLRARHKMQTFLGAGVCLPGRVTAAGRLVMAPNMNWKDYDIRSVLTEKLGLSVELENDANACLLAELWFGNLDGTRNAVLLAISEGVGASLLADGHLISGRLGLAGEFGHICVEPTGPVCGCGRRGCWEVFASTRAALEFHRSIQAGAAEMNYRELCQLAMTGDEVALQALQRQAGFIGRGLRMVMAALSPEVILFAGDISYGWPLLSPEIQREGRANRLAGSLPKLACTGDGLRAHLLGAAAIVLQRHASYYRSRPAARASSASRTPAPPRGAHASPIF